jgi:hypothetical protein
MKNSLHSFFWEDSKIRWKVYAVSVIGGTIFAAVRGLYFHKPERQVVPELIGFVLASVLLSVTVYCLRNAGQHVASILPLTLRLSPMIRFAGVFACLILLISPRVSVSTVQAAITNQRLEKAAQSLEPQTALSLSNDQLKRRFQKITSIADTSIAYGIRARPELLDRVENNLTATLKSVSPTEDVRKSGAVAFVSLVAYAHYNHALIALNAPTILLSHGETGNMMLSQVPLTHTAWWQGSEEGNTVIAIPTSAPGPVFLVSHSTVVFNLINFMGFGRGFIGTDDQSQIAVMNARVTGASQNLDSIVWLNVNFEGSKIIYHGGPLYLGDVTFKNCLFEFGEDEISRKVLSQIKEAGNSKVTIVSGL